MGKAILNFLSGMGSIVTLDTHIARPRNFDNPLEADRDALRKDFESVGRDIRSAMDFYGKKKKSASEK